jgi:uncharacterized Zn-binding protein involved in type VI secretion/phage pi2 protein 07
MGMPAARVTDLHTCPMVTGLVPHVGGPILPPCAVNVLIGNLPAARVGDLALCAGGPDTIVKGSLGVFINGQPAARIGDLTVHGGVITTGLPTVLIGDTWSGGGAGAGAGAGGDGAPDAETGTGSATPDKQPSPPEISDQKILEKFGKDIPESQKKPSGAEVTKYQSDREFKEERLKITPDIDPNKLANINGYAYNRKIFINKDKANKWTITHEQLHHYSNKSFKDKFRNINGMNFNEGTTEYFTRQISGVKRPGIYEAQAAAAEAVAKKVGDDVLRKAYFGGDPAAIEAVVKALGP